MKWQYLPDYQIIYLPQLILLAIAAFALLFFFSTDNKRFWPALLTISIATSGILIYRLSWVDEILIGFIIVGVLFHFSVNKKQMINEGKPKDNLETLHLIIFYLFMTLLIVQSIRGAIFWESPRKLLWAMQAIAFIILAWILSKDHFYFPTRDRAWYLIAIISSIYFFVIMVYCFTSEIFRGIDRWYLQTSEIGSSAQFMLPVVYSVIAFIQLQRDPNITYRLFGWAALILSGAMALYFDSRTAVLAIVISTTFFVYKLRLRNLIGLLLFFIVSVILFIEYSDLYSGNFEYFIDNMFLRALRIFEFDLFSGSTDVQRMLYVKVGFMAISDTWEHFLFGFGSRVHSYVIGPIMLGELLQYLPRAASRAKGMIGTEGFTALLVDNGIVGMLLFMGNFVCAFGQIWRLRKFEGNMPLLLMIPILFAWMFVINTMDNTLFILSIMPGGIIISLARSSVRTLEEVPPVPDTLPCSSISSTEST